MRRISVFFLLMCLAVTGSAAQTFDDASAAFNRGEHEKAFDLFRQLGLSGDLVSQKIVARMYYVGVGVEKDSQKTTVWLEKAANGGDGESQLLLSDFYAAGVGTERSIPRARYWLKKAADGGYADAEWRLGLGHWNGVVVIQDYEAAIQWFTRAAEDGHVYAPANLGDAYRNGIGVPPNIIEAHKWYNIGGSRGHKEALVKRKSIEKVMTTKDIVEAQRLAREWIATYEKSLRPAEVPGQDILNQLSEYLPPRTHDSSFPNWNLEAGTKVQATGSTGSLTTFYEEHPKVPVTILPFRNEQTYEQQISRIISDDFRRSGILSPREVGGKRPFPTELKDVDYDYWNDEGAQNLVIGSILPRDDGKVEVRFRMLDVNARLQLLGYAFLVDSRQLRATAHKIADLIYERFTGDPGVFSTKICYAVKYGEIFELQIADADGHNPQVVHRYNEPVASPKWSPDGEQVAYVSFEQRKASIYILNVFDGKRTILADYAGSNSAPAWSPDGEQLAVTLTKDGNAEIYLINKDGSGLRRLTHNGAIDTEPYFSPDGQFLLFASDREKQGELQIYQMRVDGVGTPERLTSEGEYNATPQYSPDGKSFAFVHRIGQNLNIAIQDLTNQQMQVITHGGRDQSPSFAPNGNMILYATEDESGRRFIAVVSADGKVHQTIKLPSGELSNPAWGPLLSPENLSKGNFE